jgi:hypothetical protein
MPTTPAQQAHYKRNRERYLEQSKQQRYRMQEFIQEVKSVPCKDCGIQYPYYVMQFDHVRGKKVGHVGVLATRNNLPLLKTEIEKCEIVCANCHAERTHARLVKRLSRLSSK